MKKSLIAVALAALAAGMYTAGGTAQASAGRTFTVFEDTTNETNAFVDNAPESPSDDPESPSFRLSTGDELTGRTPILDHRGGQRIGRLSFHGVVVKGRSLSLIHI